MRRGVVRNKMLKGDWNVTGHTVRFRRGDGHEIRHSWASAWALARVSVADASPSAWAFSAFALPVASADAVRTMLAVRSYRETPVPQELVRQIVETGRLTGSAKNAQPWHFIVIENRDTLRQIGALARTGPYVAEAPLVIAVVVEKTPFAVSDASRTIEAM